jgi:hypothetical protein
MIWLESTGQSFNPALPRKLSFGRFNTNLVLTSGLPSDMILSTLHSTGSWPIAHFMLDLEVTVKA